LELEPHSPIALARLGGYLAAHDDPDGAFELLVRALSPEALRFRLLASPTKYYLGLLELGGPRIPDGDVAALTSLLREQRAALARHLPDPSARTRPFALPLLPPDPHFETEAAAAHAHLAVATAFTASRLPADDVVRH